MLLCLALILPACSKMNKTQKGAVVGTAAGGTMGAIIGKATGNTAMGAIIGATVGGVTGAVIGNRMDKQAKEIEQSVPGVTVERVGEGIVVEFSNKILFEVEKSSLSESAKSSLSSLVTVLNQYPDTDIEIQGHTDSDGSTSFNQDFIGRTCHCSVQLFDYKRCYARTNYHHRFWRKDAQIREPNGRW
jgi:outer membrane protein OmpA-like peptidoglycan-associated protein